MILKSIALNKWAVLFSLLFATSSLMAQKKGMIVDKIIAKVDNHIILKSDLDKAYLDYTSRGDVSGTETKCQIFEALIINKLMLAKAKIDSVEVADEEVSMNLERRMQYIISQVGSEEMVEKYYNKTIAEFKDELFESLKEQMVIQRMQGTITEAIKITPKEVKSFYKSIPKDSLPFFSTEVAIAQIVKIPSAGEEQKQATQDLLIELKTQLKNGADWSKLAHKYSQDPSAQMNGGAMGWQTKGSFVPEYESAAFKLKPGEITDPVKTEYGYHIIQLIERRGTQFNTNHILISPDLTQADLKLAADYLDSIRTKIIADTLSFSKIAKEESDDKMTADNGGFYTSAAGGTRISVEELDPITFFTIDTMTVGTISKPLTFKSMDGKDAMRIISYQERIPPHQANLDMDYQKIRAAAIMEKKDKALQAWFEASRKEVYIEIEPEYDNCQILK